MIVLVFVAEYKLLTYSLLGVLGSWQESACLFLHILHSLYQFVCQHVSSRLPLERFSVILYWGLS
jgi:hypothetical protein